MGQAVEDYLTLGCSLHFSSGDGLHQLMLGAVVYLILLEREPLKSFEVKIEYLEYFTSSIQSLGLSLICVVSNKK